MDRHFVLPATIAAAVHLGLLFGWPHHAETRALTKARPDPLPPTPTMAIVNQPTPPDDDDTSRSGGSSIPVPTTPDVPRPEGSSKFEVPVEVAPPSRIALGPMSTIPALPVGSGDGGDFVRAMGPITIGADLLDRPPATRVQVSPQYPAAARSDGRTGEVVLEFTVDESGRVLDPRVVRSSDAVFDSAAVAAVAKWRFEPGTQNGHAVRFRMMLPLIFRLNDE